MKKIIFISSLFMIQLASYAQIEQTINDCKLTPQNNEIILDVLNETIYAGCEYDVWGFPRGKTGYLVYYRHENKVEFLTDEQLVERLINNIKNKYGTTHFYMRNYKSELITRNEMSNETTRNRKNYYYNVSATVVINSLSETNNAINKALQNIKPGSRLAVNQITVVDGSDKETLKDQIIEQILDEGYKVVAKDYLEKLYEEQQAQQSGIYNEKTIVQDNNFSAVGYFLNAKKTETSIKIQIINVSTGEYESNTIVNIGVNAPKLKEDVLKTAIHKAFQSINQGSRLALDQIRVSNGDDREDFQDKLLELLLDSGYKLVAKEYLDKLYEEQNNQQSGIYNDKTIVQDNNFSAVGYYVNAKLTETSLRIQVVNVSSGEYEGNAVINF